MAYDIDKIYRYKFTSVSNKNWKFEVEFLGGKNAQVGTYAEEFLPDSMFLDLFEIEASFKDDLQIGFKQADLLRTKINLDVLTGDWVALKNLIIAGGQFISSEFYPNQIRLLSNEGDGSENCHRIHFWGAQDLLPSNKFTKTYIGKNSATSQTVFELNVFSVERFILNQPLKKKNPASLEFDVQDYINSWVLFFGGTALTETATTFQYIYSGVNSSSQNVISRGVNGNVDVFVWSVETLENFLNWFMQTRITNYLRSWLNKNTSANTFRDIDFKISNFSTFDFFKQTYDLTTNKGVALNEETQIFLVIFLKDLDGNMIGGLFSQKSTDGVSQYDTLYDYYSNVCETAFLGGVGRGTYNDVDIRYAPTTGYPYFTVGGRTVFNNNADVLFTTNDIVKIETTTSNYVIGNSKVTFKALKDNRNKVERVSFGSLVNDSHEVKALIHSNIQLTDDISNLQVTGFTGFQNRLNEMPINQPLYFDTINSATNLYLIHRNISVFLGDGIFINTDDTAYGLTALRDGKTDNNKNINYDLMVQFIANEYNLSGLSYLQCKALNEIYKSGALLTELELLNYKVLTNNLGDSFGFNFNAELDNLNTMYKSDRHNIVSVKTNYLDGRSAVKLMTRG